MVRLFGIGPEFDSVVNRRVRGAAGLTLFSLCLLAFDWTASAQVTVAAGRYTAQFERGALVELRNSKDAVLVERKDDVSAGLHLLSGSHVVETSETTQAWDTSLGAEEKYTSLAGLAGGQGSCKYMLDEKSGDLVIEQRFQSPEKGLWGIELPVATIPLSMNIIAPVQSGLRFTPSTPGNSHSFDYPCPWEAQMVIVEGEDGGFMVWAEDVEGIYKRLKIERNANGWRLAFITMPNAPFEDKDACVSVRWHLNTYEGGWRTAAQRYRDWAEAAFKPVRVEAQTPAWVKDIRCCMIMGLDPALLEALPAHFDPAQTLLYVPNWRAAGYDRSYPDYKEVDEKLAPFVARAHELGYRVMLHVNHFGCDPKHPVYKHMEMFQCRSPWGGHERDWWVWDRAKPPIKFAYINPASKKWRSFFVKCMQELCASYAVDALHLDQTLWIYNENQGPVDGLTMLQGNVALHRELREALPEVALSGEGLNEATYRYEAFAQRHVWGIDHANRRVMPGQLTAAHPISSYLMRPFVTMYGYLGMAPPDDDQMYAAWRDAYRFYGVIPTLNPSVDALNRPEAFMRQFLDETAYWLEQKVDINVDGAWPEEVAFPFKTARGTPVTWMQDRSLMSRSRVLSRTLKDVSWEESPGLIPGWRGYTEKLLLGLDPAFWYPVFPDERDLSRLRVTSLANGYAIDAVREQENLAFFRLRLASNSTVRLAPLLGGATCGSLLVNEQRFEVTGPLQGSDGAQFYAEDENLHAHPPWKTPISGKVYALFTLTVPANAARVVSDVALSPEAVGEGKSDGVTFQICVTRNETVQQRGIFQNTSKPREVGVGLNQFRGKEVTIEFSVDAGRNNNANYDWACWLNPRIECEWDKLSDISLANMAPWRLALCGERVLSLSGQAEAALQVTLPGTLYLLRGTPASVTSDTNLLDLERSVSFISDTGRLLDAPPFAAVERGKNIVGKQTRDSLFAHPPNHGRTQIDMAITLPTGPVCLHAFAGLRDGSESEGVVFAVEANGTELFREKFVPGAWQEVRCDLKPYAGKPTVLSLVTDADGSCSHDWACWGEPAIAPGVAK